MTQPLQLLAKLEKLHKLSYKTCLYGRFISSKNCDGKGIKAHTISRANILRNFTPNGHVYSFLHDINLFKIHKNNGRIKSARKIGINNASTFYGFCSYHDNKLFEEIDQKNLINIQPGDMKLYGLRITARELYLKLRSLELFKRYLALIERNEEKITNVKMARFLMDGFIEGTFRGYEDLRKEFHNFCSILNSVLATFLPI